MTKELTLDQQILVVTQALADYRAELVRMNGIGLSFSERFGSGLCHYFARTNPTQWEYKEVNWYRLDRVIPELHHLGTKDLPNMQAEGFWFPRGDIRARINLLERTLKILEK